VHTTSRGLLAVTFVVSLPQELIKEVWEIKNEKEARSRHGKLE
jgi:metal-responsive CopG/Arc/MetJ family transcriptional regulator